MEKENKKRSKGFFHGGFDPKKLMESLEENTSVAAATVEKRQVSNHTHERFKGQILQSYNEIYDLPIDDIAAYEHQSRVHFDEDEIRGLAETIKTQGLLNPITVIKNGEIYEVISGERRLRAFRYLGKDLIPAKIITKEQALIVSVIDNQQRSNLHPLEEGKDYKKLLDEGAFLNISEMSKKLGIPRTKITELLGYVKKIPLSDQADIIDRGITSRDALREITRNYENNTTVGEKDKIPPTRTRTNLSLLRVSSVDGDIIIKSYNGVKLSDSHKEEIERILTDALE